jgi:hypothetical protein
MKKMKNSGKKKGTEDTKDMDDKDNKAMQESIEINDLRAKLKEKEMEIDDLKQKALEGTENRKKKELEMEGKLNAMNNEILKLRAVQANKQDDKADVKELADQLKNLTEVVMQLARRGKSEASSGKIKGKAWEAPHVEPVIHLRDIQSEEKKKETIDKVWKRNAAVTHPRLDIVKGAKEVVKDEVEVVYIKCAGENFATMSYDDKKDWVEELLKDAEIDSEKMIYESSIIGEYAQCFVEKKNMEFVEEALKKKNANIKRTWTTNISKKIDEKKQKEMDIKVGRKIKALIFKHHHHLGFLKCLVGQVNRSVAKKAMAIALYNVNKHIDRDFKFDEEIMKEEPSHHDE